MNSDKSAYSNALQNLGNSHYAIAQAPIEGDDSQSNLSEVGKTITTDFGNILLGHVATSSLAKLGKMGNQLSKLGINSSDAKELSRAIANGDRRKIGQMVARIGNDKVKSGIQKLTGKKLSDDEMPDAVEQQIDQNVAEAGNPVQVSEAQQSVARIQGEQPSLELDNYTQPRNEVWLGADEDEDVPAPAQAQEAPTRSASEDQYQDALESQATETEGEVSTVSKIASTGEDVASGLEDATLLSAASDDTGVGLLVTAGLGIASLFTGLFMKHSKPKAIYPPLIAPNNTAIQAGIT